MSIRGRHESSSSTYIASRSQRSSNPKADTLDASGYMVLYPEETEVPVWLGPADSDSDVVMDVWEAVGQDARS